MAAAATSTEALRKGIAEFYNETSGLWEDIWGDHMHHGFYDPDSSVQLSDSDHREAQIRMIEESLRFGGVTGSFLQSFALIRIIELDTLSVINYIMVNE